MVFGWKSKQTAVEVNPYHAWAARFWHGMLLGPWLRLVWRNRRGSASRAGAGQHDHVCLGHQLAVAGPLQSGFYDRFIDRTQIKDAQIFILGHWRSARRYCTSCWCSTRYTFPTTYECLAPNHFLVSAWLVTKLKFLLPSKRPMDNMITGWDRPQEDEFALVNMGLPSPYLTMAFPNSPRHYPEYMTLENVPSEELARWKAGLEWFLKRVTFRSPQRIILKSPPHTGRVKALLELFPDARFVHICRPRTQSMDRPSGCGERSTSFSPSRNRSTTGWRSTSFPASKRCTARRARIRALIDPARFYEIRYEDLVPDVISQMRALYDHLKLGEFENVLPKLHEYIKDTKDYRSGGTRFPTLCARRSTAAGVPTCTPRLLPARRRRDARLTHAHRPGSISAGSSAGVDGPRMLEHLGHRRDHRAQNGAARSTCP